MRTASDFDAYYADADPWRISGARSRDEVLRRSVARFVTGKKVLELGCGEGHLTQALFWDAASVKGVDISRLRSVGRFQKGFRTPATKTRISWTFRMKDTA